MENNERGYKQYIIEYEKMPAQLQEKIQPYEHFCSQRVPYCTITLRTEDQEKSLLEVLATIEGITYREALPRKTFDER